MTKLKEAQKREDMLLDLYKFHAYIPNDAMGNTLTSFGNFCEGYEAARAIDAKRIADFGRYQIKTEGVIATLENTILDLEAQNKAMREVLQAYSENKKIGLAATCVLAALDKEGE